MKKKIALIVVVIVIVATICGGIYIKNKEGKNGITSTETEGVAEIALPEGISNENTISIDTGRGAKISKTDGTGASTRLNVEIIVEEWGITTGDSNESTYINKLADKKISNVKIGDKFEIKSKGSELLSTDGFTIEITGKTTSNLKILTSENIGEGESYEDTDDTYSIEIGGEIDLHTNTEFAGEHIIIKVTGEE